MVIIYDCDDNIITVLDNAKSINAFKNGYLGFVNYDHHEIV